jgi:hydroxymethylglutaryl-CoA reductase
LKTSQISGFYKLTLEKRLELVKEFANLTTDEQKLIRNTGSLTPDIANHMIENVVGTIPIPLGIAVNFLINGKDYLIPMAIEEPSVVAAASYAAKIARKTGGFTASSTKPIMIGQIQVVNIKDVSAARTALLKGKHAIITKANEQDPVLVALGGGAKDLEVKILDTEMGPMIIAELLINCRDAMGANAVNTMTEAVAPMIEEITKGRVYLRILSNLADRRLVRANVIVDKKTIGGEEVVDGIVQAYHFAVADPYRCATHNKGIMNGVISIVLATGNDHRAVEAGAHVYAVRSGKYTPLTIWKKDRGGNLVGSIEMPMAVGIVGGATKAHPIAQVAIKILGVKTSTELGEIIASVGLAQNLAALRALVAEGIQRGHMALHARNIAIEVGATGTWVETIARKMVEERNIRRERAKHLFEKLKKSEPL